MLSLRAGPSPAGKDHSADQRRERFSRRALYRWLHGDQRGPPESHDERTLVWTHGRRSSRSGSESGLLLRDFSEHAAEPSSRLRDVSYPLAGGAGSHPNFLLLVVQPGFIAGSQL